MLPSDYYKQLTPLNKACEDLLENAYYSVEIQLYEANVAHGGILFTGYKETGGYRSLFCSTYHLTPVNTSFDTVRVKVLNHIPEINGYPQG